MLSFQKSRRKVDLIRRDFVQPQHGNKLLLLRTLEEIERRLAAGLVPFCTVDVAHEENHVVLVIGIERLSLVNQCSLRGDSNTNAVPKTSQV